MPNAPQSDGVPDHNAIIALSFRVEDGGVQPLGSTSNVHSSVEHGSSSPRASAVVPTGGVAKRSVMPPENMYIQKDVLSSDLFRVGAGYRLKHSISTHSSYLPGQFPYVNNL